MKSLNERGCRGDCGTHSSHLHAHVTLPGLIQNGGFSVFIDAKWTVPLRSLREGHLDVT